MLASKEQFALLKFSNVLVSALETPTVSWLRRPTKHRYVLGEATTLNQDNT